MFVITLKMSVSNSDDLALPNFFVHVDPNHQIHSYIYFLYHKKYHTHCLQKNLIYYFNIQPLMNKNTPKYMK